jgi:cytochrome c-type protein NapB
MVSVTHYMDRDNNFLADLSPRRYFCTQCHAPQLDAKLLVENDFVDIDHLMKAKAPVKH